MSDEDKIINTGGKGTNLSFQTAWKQTMANES